MTLLSWRNHFTCDIFAENGIGAHQFAVQMGTVVASRCARAVLPSGRPPEETMTSGARRSDLGDRIRAFQERCARTARVGDLADDLWLNRTLRRLGDEAIKEAAR